MKFLIHIMIQLKQMGFLNSTRGKSGGYILAKAPKEIRLSDVVDGFSEMKLNVPTSTLRSKKGDVLHEVWEQADKVLLEYFVNINFEELVKRERSRRNVAMYSI